MEASIWGPKAWVFLHSITMNYPEKPTDEDKAIEDETANIFLFCPSCGFNNEKKFKFCPKCGAALSS